MILIFTRLSQHKFNQSLSSSQATPGLQKSPAETMITKNSTSTKKVSVQPKGPTVNSLLSISYRSHRRFLQGRCSSTFSRTSGLLQPLLTPLKTCAVLPPFPLFLSSTFSPASLVLPWQRVGPPRGSIRIRTQSISKGPPRVPSSLYLCAVGIIPMFSNPWSRIIHRSSPSDGIESFCGVTTQGDVISSSQLPKTTKIPKSTSLTT